MRLCVVWPREHLEFVFGLQAISSFLNITSYRYLWLTNRGSGPSQAIIVRPERQCDE